MKKEIRIPITQEAITLVPNVVYKMERFWYDMTLRPMKMSVLMPKHWQEHAPQPLVLWLCGGGFQVMDENIWIPQMIDFARAGFTVASVEYRTAHTAPFPAELVDVKAAIRYLRAHKEEFCFDGEHIFVMGESAGGAIASEAGLITDPQYDVGEYLEESSAVTGVVDFYGVVDQTVMAQRRTETYEFFGATVQRLGGFPEDRQEVLEACSAIRYVTPESVPFMILHGSGDDTVPIAQSEAMHEALTKAGVDCDFYIIEGAGHGEDEFYQKEVIDLIIDFMRRHI